MTMLYTIDKIDWYEESYPGQTSLHIFEKTTHHEYTIDPQTCTMLFGGTYNGWGELDFDEKHFNTVDEAKAWAENNWKEFLEQYLTNQVGL